MRAALILLALVASIAAAVNVRIANPDGSIGARIDQPNCAAWSVAVGPKGNALLTPSNCATVPPVDVPAICPNDGHPLQVLQGTLDWNVGAGIATYSSQMRTGNAYVYAMHTGPASSLATLIIAEYGGAAPYRTMVISRTPCDFNALDPANAWGVGTTAEANFSVGTANQYGYPALLPDTTYYINIRNATWQDPATDTCPLGADCKFVMSLRHQ